MKYHIEYLCSHGLNYVCLNEYDPLKWSGTAGHKDSRSNVRLCVARYTKKIIDNTIDYKTFNGIEKNSFRIKDELT